MKNDLRRKFEDNFIWVCILFEPQGRQGVNLSSFQEEEDGEEKERQLSHMMEVGLRDTFRGKE